MDGTIQHNDLKVYGVNGYYPRTIPTDPRNKYAEDDPVYINKMTCMYSIKQQPLKSKNTKILNSEEISQRKVPNQMAKSNDKIHQTNEQQLSYS